MAVNLWAEGNQVMPTRLIVSALAVMMAWAGPAAGQDWPTRPVTMVVAYVTGGPVDTVARIVASRLSEVLGQQVVVENVGRAGGTTGASRGAQASPDRPHF